MNPFAHLDSAFAEQFGLTKIAPSVAPGMEVQEVYMGHLLLGNADIAINNREAVHGICADGD
ncbi:hypothetical protein [Stenotrophomonas cyclobalanopsidis]|uniref:hypothetical protein n=1 Tax=Stenotrophomonas cyclobalanopsidis TaxID=2771362 RepID=UPI002FD9629C